MRTTKKPPLVEDRRDHARLLREPFDDDGSLNVGLICVGSIAEAEGDLDKDSMKVGHFRGAHGR